MKKPIMTDRQANDLSNKLTIQYMEEGLSNCRAYEKACDYIIDHYKVIEGDEKNV